MAVNDVTIAGVTFPGVPSVELQKAGGGTAKYTDVSDTTAQASDVAEGSYFYTAAGVRTLGTGSTGGGVTVTETPDIHGGTIVEITTSGRSDTWSWLGKNPQKIYDSGVDTKLFKNTPWATWTPTTTQTQMYASETLTTWQADMEQYEYWIRFAMYEELHYQSGATNNGKLNKMVNEIWYTAVRYASNLANLAAGTRNANYLMQTYNQSVMDYYGTNGAQSLVYSTGYGIYTSATSSSFSNSVATNPTISLKSQVMYARCYPNYLSVDNAALVDQDASFYKTKYEVWRVDAGSTGLRTIQDNRMNIFINGLS